MRSFSYLGFPGSSGQCRSESLAFCWKLATPSLTPATSPALHGGRLAEEKAVWFTVTINSLLRTRQELALKTWLWRACASPQVSWTCWRDAGGYHVQNESWEHFPMLCLCLGLGSLGRTWCLSWRSLGSSVLSILEEVKCQGPQRPSGGAMPGTSLFSRLLPSLLHPLTLPPVLRSLPSLPFCSPASLSSFSPISILKATHSHQEIFFQYVA